MVYDVVTSQPEKIVSLDNHVALACAGLKADARVLINKARIDTRYIAGLQQKYTQSGGVRPFGLSTLIVGFDPYSRVPSLYQTDPSGTFSAWKANSTGRNSNSIREFLEKNYKETSGQETVKLAIRALLEVVESGGKNIEVAVMTREESRKKLKLMLLWPRSKQKRQLLKQPRKALKRTSVTQHSAAISCFSIVISTLIIVFHLLVCLSLSLPPVP